MSHHDYDQETFGTEDSETFAEDSTLLELYSNRICRRIIAWQVTDLEELPKSIEDEAVEAAFADEAEFQEITKELDDAIAGTDALGLSISGWKAELAATR